MTRGLPPYERKGSAFPTAVPKTPGGFASGLAFPADLH